MPPLRTILFAADLSPNSVDAFRIASSLAARDDALLIVLHVIDPDGDQEAGSSPGTEAPAATREERMREFYVPIHPIEVAYRTSEGRAATEILRTADEVGADLIALGTHGAPGCAACGPAASRCRSYVGRAVQSLPCTRPRRAAYPTRSGSSSIR